MPAVTVTIESKLQACSLHKHRTGCVLLAMGAVLVSYVAACHNIAQPLV